MPTTLDRPPKISPPTPPARPRHHHRRRSPEDRGATRGGATSSTRGSQGLPCSPSPPRRCRCCFSPRGLLARPDSCACQVRRRGPGGQPHHERSITASEFKFSPNSIQVPVGQKVTFTLDNTGSVEHDLTSRRRLQRCWPEPARSPRASSRSTRRACSTSSARSPATRMPG